MGKQSIAWLPRRYFPGSHLWVRRDKLAWSSFLSCDTTRWHWGGKGRGGGGGVLPYISHIGMCRPKGLGFCAVLVWKRVQTLPILVWNRVWVSRGRHPTPHHEFQGVAPLSGGYGLKPRQLLFFSRILAQKAILMQIWIKKIKKDNTGSRYWSFYELNGLHKPNVFLPLSVDSHMV